MAIIPKFFIDAVVSIGQRNSDNTISWIGTGFYVGKKIAENQYKPFLVTNKHVVNGLNTIIIRMKKKDTGELLEINADLMKSDGSLITKYHSNPAIDIAVIPLFGKFITNNNIDFSLFDIDDNAMDSKELISNGADEGSLIYMLGYPLGRVNEKSKLPICRLGCIARCSEEQILESNNMLVDIQNFPGNSGSPIILRPEIISIDGKVCKRCVLIGIIHSYIPYQEKLVNTQTGQLVEIRQENSGLANAHPVEFIREIINS